MAIKEQEEDALYAAFLNEPDERMIAPAQDGQPSVEFKFGGGWRDCRIWQGYFDAGLILLGKVLRQSPRVDNLIFPAVFNLRHATEVALKWHIRRGGGTLPRYKGHDLCALIVAFRQTAQDLDDDITYISEPMLNCISELSTVDPHSIAFRYSSENNGIPIKITPERWNICRLYFMASHLSLWFDNLSGHMDLCRDDEYLAFLRGK